MPKVIEIDERAANVLAEAQINGPLLRLQGQLDRRQYEQVNAVLEAIGGKWSRKAGGHLFPADVDVAGQLEAALTERSLTANPLDFWATPGPLASMLAERAAGAVDGLGQQRILEPSAGDGDLIKALVCDLDEWGDTEIVAVEVDPIRARRLQAIKYPFLTVENEDFLAYVPLGRFDAVVMNPPFNSPAKRNVYIEHIKRAYSFLSPGGLLLAIAPAGFTFNAHLAEFKAWVQARGSWEDLPGDSFRASGTGVSLVLIALEG